LKERGIDAIDGRTRAGKIAKSWRRHVLALKGGKACPYHRRVEIDAATFELRELCLQSHMIADARVRSTLLNRSRGKLPAIHEQYETISARFERRVEALELDKGGLDLARRLSMHNGGQK
jgi:hypothetical protein